MTDPNASGDPNTLGAEPWYTSAVQKAQVVAFLSTLLALFPQVTAKYHITSDQVSTAVTLIFGVLAGVAGLIGIGKRAASSIQPLTLTQAKADSHPATAMANSKANPPTT